MDQPLKKLLTRRELEVLALIATHHTDHDIAERLGIKVNTAETHTRNILHKLGVRNRGQAARRYLRSLTGNP